MYLNNKNIQYHDAWRRTRTFDFGFLTRDECAQNREP